MKKGDIKTWEEKMEKLDLKIYAVQSEIEALIKEPEARLSRLYKQQDALENKYCDLIDVECETCSKVNYSRDCRNSTFK